ncbi:nuclear transport factor 2 family protein [Nocardia sp. NBC_01388]|uniref:nuclear transport factor 2 family protein n=1 Tax=Nocardia sp. NBC_01388 TaxID=2903596 RepID=UPI003865CE1F
MLTSGVDATLQTARSSAMARIQKSTQHSKSPDHDPSRITDFLVECEKQEAFHVEHGLPAQGTAGFMRKWFTAWENQDAAGIVDCCTDDVLFVDPGTGGLQAGKQTLFAYTEKFLEAIPDLVFYPQPNVLPYWDFYGGQRRVTMPWNAIGCFTNTLALPDWPALSATDRNLNFVGIDRYLINDDLKMTRCDTDYDLVGILQQCGLMPNLLHPSIRGAVAFQRAVSPLLRAFAPK